MYYVIIGTFSNDELSSARFTTSTVPITTQVSVPRMSILNYQLLDDHLATAEERVMAFVICVEKVSRMIIINTIQNYPWLKRKLKGEEKKQSTSTSFLYLLVASRFAISR